MAENPFKKKPSLPLSAEDATIKLTQAQIAELQRLQEQARVEEELEAGEGDEESEEESEDGEEDGEEFGDEAVDDEDAGDEDLEASGDDDADDADESDGSEDLEEDSDEEGGEDTFDANGILAKEHFSGGLRPFEAKGKMKDREGKLWDYVTTEGMGFNDADGVEQMTFDRNGTTYMKPDWGNWSGTSHKTYWDRYWDIEETKHEGPEAYARACRKYGLRNANQWARVMRTFEGHRRKDEKFLEEGAMAKLRHTQNAVRGKMAAAAKKGGVLDPIDGVSLETYATIQGRRIKLTGGAAAFGKLLAEYGLDEEKFARADKAWMARMSDPSDMDAMMAVATEYGKFFSAASTGQFASAAKAGAAVSGINAKAGQAPKGGEPCTFERFCEIQTAMAVWAEQGKDVNAMMKQAFQLDAMDWSNLGAYWSAKLVTDPKLAMKLTEYEPKYRQRYSAGGGGQDDDLAV